MALVFRSSHPAKSGTNIWARQQETERLSSKFRPALTARAQPIIPCATIFAALDNTKALKRDDDVLSNIAECAVHLEFLEATFVVLKQKILTSNALDRAFDLIPKDTLQTVGRTRLRKQDPFFKQRREVKWLVYIRLAAARFMLWWKALPWILPKDAGEGHAQLTLNTLPPLDVLMIWHGFLLNPLRYKEFCENSDCPERHQLDFPWKDIHLTLAQHLLVPEYMSLLPDSSGFLKKALSFDLSVEAAALFTKHVGAPDLFTVLAAHSSHTTSTQIALRNLISSVDTITLPIAIPGILPADLTDSEWAFVKTLVGNVDRQAWFPQRISDRLWLRSPALEGTLARAIVRFEHFMALFKAHPQSILVPTLDIDLVWHTVQCAPKTYEKLCMRLAGRIIDHNDALGEVKLKDGFQETKKLYESKIQAEYDVCLCWECEGIRSELESLGTSARVNLERLAEKVRDDIDYHKAVELARRSRRMLPVRGAGANLIALN